MASTETQRFWNSTSRSGIFQTWVLERPDRVFPIIVTKVQSSPQLSWISRLTQTTRFFAVGGHRKTCRPFSPRFALGVHDSTIRDPPAGSTSVTMERSAATEVSVVANSVVFGGTRATRTGDRRVFSSGSFGQ